MEISLQHQTAAPFTRNTNEHGAATANRAAQTRQSDQAPPAPTPVQLGVLGAVNEAQIGALKPNKPEAKAFDRTLKPYDTAMLPHSLADEKRLNKTA